MDMCFFSGKLTKLDVTDSAITIVLEGDYSEELRRQKEDSRLTRLDIANGFVGEPVEATLKCFTPRIPEKTRKALQIIK